jgi:type II secretory pathway component PulJ
MNKYWFRPKRFWKYPSWWKKRKWSGGYIGLLTLLVSIVIIAMIAWKLNLFGERNEGENNAIQQDMQAIEQAKLLKDALERRNRQMIGE